ncbi:hypothetical protein JX265_003547 [Neoarthrinium moseri]|uniref:Phospholipase n=1 Tax=Neoarthrinium moseri TaxID=1658444 RepID=A0A9P9WSE5_9PEZI|nr:hypothetical protein JX265_003547 [Neoarthrinium moseri]
MDRFFHKLEEKLDEVKDVFGHGDNDRRDENRPQEERPQERPHEERPPRHEEDPLVAHHQDDGRRPEPVNTNRYQSFASPTTGGAKWYVDGASYFWAVSVALEQAKESIYILDWWLSPELYLRRPPARNEQYRLDNMLRAAAERGVQVNIIVYKEVTQALTLNSEHTKHALEGLHQNVRVFRHPDHGLDVDGAKADLEAAFSNLSMGALNAFKLSSAPQDAVKSLYGSAGEVVLYWAHHEKLCLVDRTIAFMGGLDMCFGRYDTNSHPIADAHPGNLDAIIFPGQDYNNARVFDFEGVDNWNHNQLDRTKSSRMGWSDISISLNGPIVSSLLDHFVDRWNFIWNQKYKDQDPGKYQQLEFEGGSTIASGNLSGDFQGRLRGRQHRYGGEEEYGRGDSGSSGNASIQLCRSCTDWSAGHPTEHSIQNAYIDAIGNARHFVYIENQFFITATSDEQHPVKNKIGAAIVERIMRAHNAREEFRVIVLMPAVPAFAGDLHADGALGTRAIMEFQYNSINRGGHSIMEALRQQGVEDPRRYITFYNLRNYDRINTSETMGRAEGESGVPYEEARRDFDDRVGAGNYPYGEREEGRRDDYGGNQYERYQRAAESAPDQTWDTISACYMDGGAELNRLPWQGSPESEIDAYVSEELYIHSKVLIADDKLVICGSANLNDRSQLGDHDSEIAVIIEDQEPIETTMNGQQFTASKFATSLRRQLFRKHLGLLPDQRVDSVNANWTPITQDAQEYDWDSPADRLVADPMTREFWDLWTGTARTNTEVFNKVFHPVPTDLVRTWDEYEQFFSRHFIIPGVEMKEEDKQGKVEYGHVVREEFPGGVGEVKEWLGRVRGTLVEMPLEFLIDVHDLAKEGLSLNTFTDEIYT